MMNTIVPSRSVMIRAALTVLLAVPLAAQTPDRLDATNVSIAQTTFKGRSAVQVMAAPDAANAASFAVIKDVSLRDGTIEVDLAGQPGCRCGRVVPAGSLASPFGLAVMEPPSTSIYDPPTAGPTIRSGAITPRNTVRTPILISLDRGKRLLKNMSRMWIWSQVCGPSTRLRSKAVGRGFTCTERSNRASSSTI
jgi:hypothetical protein